MIVMDLETLLVKARERGVNGEEFKRRIQDTYLTLMYEAKLDDVLALEEMTGIAPAYQEEVIQDVFAHYLSDSLFDPLKRLWEKSRIKPNESVIQEAFKNYFDSRKLDEISKLKRLTKSEPEEGIVQQAYCTWVENFDFSSIQKVKDLTGIMPSDEVSKKLYSLYEINDGGYSGCKFRPQRTISDLKDGRYDTSLQNLKEIVNYTGIIPPDADVQTIFLGILQGGKWNFFDYFKNTISKDPSNKTIQNALAFHLKRRDFEQLDNMQHVLGAKPNEEEVQQTYEECARDGYLSEIKELQKRTGFEPNQRVTEALVETILSNNRDGNSRSA